MELCNIVLVILISILYSCLYIFWNNKCAWQIVTCLYCQLCGFLYIWISYFSIMQYHSKWRLREYIDHNHVDTCRARFKAAKYIGGEKWENRQADMVVIQAIILDKYHNYFLLIIYDAFRLFTAGSIVQWSFYKSMHQVTTVPLTEVLLERLVLFGA